MAGKSYYKSPKGQLCYTHQSYFKGSYCYRCYKDRRRRERQGLTK